MMALRDQVIPAADLRARLSGMPGWHGDTAGISRDYPAGWDTAAALMPAIASLAVEMEHRPDLDIRWAGLRVFLTTHTAGDVVTELDLAMASRLDALAAGHGAAGVLSGARPFSCRIVQAPRRPGKADGALSSLLNFTAASGGRPAIIA